MTSREERSKLWNYFEELKPSLVKCTNCKKEIHIPDPTISTQIFRAHLNGHGIFLDTDTLTLPDDLRQYYSELPGYKAKCNDCGQTMSFLTDQMNLRYHLTRHSTRIQNLDEVIPMAPKIKRSKLCNYFEELKPSLVKCRKCTEEIRIDKSNMIRNNQRVLRAHLKEDGIYADEEHTIPDDLRQHYSELPGYKAKCNYCGKILSFFSQKIYLRLHLRRRHHIMFKMVSRKKRSKLWNYFKELKPGLVKCKKCKKQIQVLYPSYLTTIFRTHLKRHGIFLDNDTRTLPDDLRQYYSELPEYKAKCNDCGKTLSFLINNIKLRHHLTMRHSTRIRSRDETFKMVSRKKYSKLWDYFEELKSSLVKCTKCKKEIRISCSSNRITTCRSHLKRHGVFPDNNTRTLPEDLRCPQKKKSIEVKSGELQLLEDLPLANRLNMIFQHDRAPPDITRRLRTEERDGNKCKKRSSIWNNYDVTGSRATCKECKKDIKAEISNLWHHLRRHSDTGCPQKKKSIGVKSGELQLLEDLPLANRLNMIFQHDRAPPDITRRLRTEARDGQSTSSPTSYVMDPNAERQSQETVDLVLQSCEQSRKETRERDGSSISHSTNMDPNTECQSLQKRVDLIFQSYAEQLRKEQRVHNGPSTSSPTGNVMDSNAERQSQETVDLNLQSYYELSIKETRIRDEVIVLAPKIKRSKLWDYYEELKSSLVKCTICKKEIQISHPSGFKNIFETHLNGHGIFFYNDTLILPLILPDDLKQYYSELPGDEARCNNCGQTVSFLTDDMNLRYHLTRHSTRIQSRDESSISNSTGFDAEPNTERQSQETVDLALQSCEHWRKETRARDGLSTSTNFDGNCSTELQSQEPLDLSLQLCEQSTKETRARDGTELQSQEPLDLSLQLCEQSRKETRARDGTSSSTGYVMDPNAERQSQDTVDLVLQSCEQSRKETRARDGSSISHSTNMDPNTECQSLQERVDLIFQSYAEQFRKEQRVHNGPSTSSPTGYVMDSNAERQSQETVDLILQSYYELSIKETRTCDGTSSSTGYVMDPNAERQSQETVDLVLQSCKQSRKETRARDGVIVMAPKRKHSKLWDYFEELIPSLVKCTICKKKIQIPYPSSLTTIFRTHLNGHGIFFDNDTLTLPDDLRQYYLELPGYKAKCNDCGQTVSFLTDMMNLRYHLTSHSMRFQSRDEPTTSNPKCYITDIRTVKYTLLRQSKKPPSVFVQLVGRTVEKTDALDSDWFYYTIPSTSSSADCIMDPSAERQCQEPLDLFVQSFEPTTEGTGALDSDWFYYTIPSTSSSTDYDMDPNAETSKSGTV